MCEGEMDMSIVNSTLNSSSLYNVQTNSQVENTQRAHHHHHKDKSQASDSIQVDNESSQLSGSNFNNGASSILNNLVSDGTLTQDQENAVQSAFQAAKQSNSSSSGTYNSSGNKLANPISNLVANGTISQSQADSIQSAFKAAHHNHHHVDQTQTEQDIINPTGDEEDSLVQALENQDPSLLGSSSNDTEAGSLQSLENPDMFASDN